MGDSLLSDAVLALDGLKDLVRRRRDRREVTPQEHRMAPHPPSRRGEVEGALSARRALEVVRAAVATMSRYPRSADDVPDHLGIPHWSWSGLVDPPAGD